MSFSIALLTYSTKPRGSVIHTLELAEALHRRGHEVCVYALDKDGKGFDRPVSCHVKLIPAQSAPVNVDQLIHQRIQEFVDGLTQESQRYDIYHAQDCLSANALTQLRRQHLDPDPVPCLVRTVHHVENYTSSYLRDCQEQSIREADLCLCVSQHWQSELQAQYGIHAPRVINGINTQRFTPQRDGNESKLQEQFGIHSEVPTYLTVGGIEPRKNSICLLNAFAQVLKAHPQAQLVIAGGATLFDYQSYRDKFFAEVERLGIAVGQSLLLPGVISDEELPMLYRLADAFVFPSLKEGWGMVILEAIADRLPVIVSNQAPFTEFLDPNQALWVDPWDEKAIAQAMITILQPELRHALVTSSQTVLPEYSWDSSAYLHEIQYSKVLQSVPLTITG